MPNETCNQLTLKETPWSRYRTVAQLVMNSPAFYETQRFIQISETWHHEVRYMATNFRIIMQSLPARYKNKPSVKRRGADMG
jgi:hypothetical protein